MVTKGKTWFKDTWEDGADRILRRRKDEGRTDRRLEKLVGKELLNSYFSLNCNYWQDDKLTDYEIYRA